MSDEDMATKIDTRFKEQLVTEGYYQLRRARPNGCRRLRRVRFADKESAKTAGYDDDSDVL
ncbi:hypothetical protein BYT27DRAFT_7184108, partial [Phlegmacium glaucopus]